MATNPTPFDWRSPRQIASPAGDGVFLAGLSERVLDRLALSASTTSYVSGAVIFHAGAPLLGVYIVRRGQAALSLTSRSGKRLVLRSARVGDILGLSACLQNKPHPASLESHGPCSVSFIPKHAFLRFMRSDNELCFRVAQYLSAEVEHLSRGIDLMGLTRSAEQKLAAFFLQLYVDGHGAPPTEGDTLRLRLTHQELSHRVGMARETVTRALLRLRRARAIEVDDAVLCFLDPALLHRIERGARLRGGWFTDSTPSNGRRGPRSPLRRAILTRVTELSVTRQGKLPVRQIFQNRAKIDFRLKSAF